MHDKMSKNLVTLVLLNACALAAEVTTGFLNTSLGWRFLNPVTQSLPANFVSLIGGMLFRSASW